MDVVKIESMAEMSEGQVKTEVDSGEETKGNGMEGEETPPFENCLSSPAQAPAEAEEIFASPAPPIENHNPIECNRQLNHGRIELDRLQKKVDELEKEKGELVAKNKNLEELLKVRSNRVCVMVEEIHDLKQKNEEKIEAQRGNEIMQMELQRKKDGGLEDYERMATARPVPTTNSTDILGDKLMINEEAGKPSSPKPIYKTMSQLAPSLVTPATPTSSLLATLIPPPATTPTARSSPIPIDSPILPLPLPSSPASETPTVLEVKEPRPSLLAKKGHICDIKKRQHGFYCVCGIKFISRRRLDGHLAFHKKQSKDAKPLSAAQVKKEKIEPRKSVKETITLVVGPRLRSRKEGNASGVQSKNSKGSSSPKRVLCKVCDQLVSTLFYLYAHMVRVHQMTNVTRQEFYMKYKMSLKAAETLTQVKKGRGRPRKSSSIPVVWSEEEFNPKSRREIHQVDKTGPPGQYCTCGLEFPTERELGDHIKLKAAMATRKKKGYARKTRGRKFQRK